MTVSEACGKYLLEHGQYLRSYAAVKAHCTHLLAFLGSVTPLSALSDRDVNAYVAHRRALLDAEGERKITDSTINRELNTLRKLLATARDRWEVAVGTVGVSKHKLREPEARTRWITREQAEALIAHAADHLKEPIHFALLTGVRLSNVTGLRWKDVSLADSVITFRIKSNIPGGKLLTLPIAPELDALLRRVQQRPLYRNRCRVLDDNKLPVVYRPGPEDYVFSYKGEPIVKFRRSFASACKDAGIEDFRFHDLRHTAASWMVQAGVPIDLVQEILGHTQITTTKKYAHRDQREKREALEKLLLSDKRTSQNRRAS